jgi:F-type H+-transporting ATPase subunit b
MAMQTEDHGPAATDPGITPGAAHASPGHEGVAPGAHGAAEAHAEGGLPQFDFAQWPGQIAWFLIVFFALLAFVRFFAAPKVGGTIEAREAKISGDIAEARRMKEEADAQAQAAAQEAAQARAQAQKVAAEARAKAQAEIAARLGEEEAKLAAAGAEAEARIAKAREAAMANVSGIASDTAKAIVEKLTGKTATAAELSAAAKG